MAQAQKGRSPSQKSQIYNDFEQLMKAFEQVDRNLITQTVPDRVILLLGQTKAGKTTLMYYLQGMKLIRVFNKKIGLYQMQPQTKINQAQIGNLYESETVYPNIPAFIGDDRVLLIDMPGFSDTRYMFRLLNIYIIRQVIKKIKSVHVSLVVPNETFEANYLTNIIQRNCFLLDRKFVLSPGCISFILTKVEDKKSDLEAFKQFLELIKEDSSNQALTEAIGTLSNANTYIFQNKDPDVKAGVAMKAQIVTENRFFQTDYLPENLLSEFYADIISGQQNPAQLFNFIVELLGVLEQNLSLLIKAFSVAVQLQYFHDFKTINFQLDKQESKLVDQLQQICKQIHAAGISNIKVSLNEDDRLPSEQLGLLRLTKKFYNFKKGQQAIKQNIFDGQLDYFVERSNGLVNQESRISLQLRKKMYELFTFCNKALTTISNIKQLKIIEEFNKFCKESQVLNAIEAYKQIDKSGDLILKIAQSQIGALKLAEMQEFTQILFAFKPNFSFGQFQQVIQHKKVYTRDRIKKKNLLQTLETTKQIETHVHKHHEFKTINITQISRASINTIKNMPLESINIQTLFTSIKKFKNQFQKSTDELKTQFGMVLFRKIGQLFEKLQVYEEGVLFYLAIPAQIQAEKLINNGLDFNKLSQDFIKSVLLPYYSQWNPNFLMVQTLFNYLTLNTYDPSKIYEIEQQLANTLQKMHQIDYDNLPVIKRFEFGLIDRIYMEGSYRSYILDYAKRKEEKLNKSKVQNLSRELATFKLY